MFQHIRKVLTNKEVSNAGWIIGGKIAQMVLSFLVGIFTARFLGPQNYGLINYAGAYVSFFSSLCTLGINYVIVKDFLNHPNSQGETLGTTLVLRALSSIFSGLMIVSIVSVIDAGEHDTIIVAVLCSVSVVFQTFSSINNWFQSRYQSKVSSIASLVAYITSTIYKIILLILGKSVYWFAFATSVDYIVDAVFLLIAYKKNGGQKLQYSKKKARELLRLSYHYIISGMMIAIYGQTDKLMLKQMLNETAVGYYGLATSICAMWVFVLQAIIDSGQPTIIKLYDVDYHRFEKKNRQLYAIVFYVSCFVSIVFMLIGEPAIVLLYGEAYRPAAWPLRIVTWYTAFSYLGVARNTWIVCEHKQKYLKYMYCSAAVINIVLNYIMIPIYGTSGAALASLITQIFTSIILPLMFKDMRRNAKLMIQGILFRDIK